MVRELNFHYPPFSIMLVNESKIGLLSSAVITFDRLYELDADPTRKELRSSIHHNVLKLPLVPRLRTNGFEPRPFRE
jgi:hypothetical protein